MEVAFTTITHVVHSDWAATVSTSPCVCYIHQEGAGAVLKVSDVYLENNCVCCG